MVLPAPSNTPAMVVALILLRLNLVDKVDSIKLKFNVFYYSWTE